MNPKALVAKATDPTTLVDLNKGNTFDISALDNSLVEYLKINVGHLLSGEIKLLIQNMSKHGFKQIPSYKHKHEFFTLYFCNILGKQYELYLYYSSKIINYKTSHKVDNYDDIECPCIIDSHDCDLRQVSSTFSLELLTTPQSEHKIFMAKIKGHGKKAATK